MHLVTEARTEVRREAAMQGLAGWVLRTLSGLQQRTEKRHARKQMRVVETLPLGAKQRLLLVSCGGERFLVGTGPESVGTIVRVRPETGGLAAVRESGERR